jgi:thiol-disulfide isomerase/thioredoxin
MRYLACLLLPLLLSACGGPEGKVNSLRLDQLRGQWVVINYWAKWCKPCIKEIPELNSLDQDYPEVTVLGVNYDNASGEELQAQLRQLDVQFTTLAEDPAAQLGVPRPVVLPTTLVLGPDGALRDTLVGPQTLESLARATGQAAQQAEP